MVHVNGLKGTGYLFPVRTHNNGAREGSAADRVDMSMKMGLVIMHDIYIMYVVLLAHRYPEFF